MKKLYKDFGNVFEYEGVEGFWRWWRERGQLLFSAKPLSNIDAFLLLMMLKITKVKLIKDKYYCFLFLLYVVRPYGTI